MSRENESARKGAASLAQEASAAAAVGREDFARKLLELSEAIHAVYEEEIIDQLHRGKVLCPCGEASTSLEGIIAWHRTTLYQSQVVATVLIGEEAAEPVYGRNRESHRSGVALHYACATGHSFHIELAQR